MQLHKIKTALIRFVSQGSKRSVDSKLVKKSKIQRYTKSKANENARCIWDLEHEG